MKFRLRRLSLPFYLALLLFLTGCPPEACTDCSNPDCDNYDPCCATDCDEAKSQVVYDKITSAILENNLVNEDTERAISVYLPKGYQTESSRSYPVLYLLHGYLADHTTWYAGTLSELYGPRESRGINLAKTLDNLIEDGSIEPLIVVCPDNNNSFEGSWYTNSIVTGNWEDFMVEEVVPYVDANFRTLAVPESRGIAGHSMGAYGAFLLAMKHPDVYGAVYALSGTLEFALTYIYLNRDELIAATQVSDLFWFLDPYVKLKISRAIAYAPNPALRPFMGELPLDENGTLIDSTWQKWLEHDIYSMVGDYEDNLKSLKAIRFDCGKDDESHISCLNLSEALTDLGIGHLFESYSGNHTDMIPERMGTKVFPYFSEYLEHSK